MASELPLRDSAALREEVGREELEHPPEADTAVEPVPAGQVAAAGSQRLAAAASSVRSPARIAPALERHVPRRGHARPWQLSSSLDVQSGPRRPLYRVVRFVSSPALHAAASLLPGCVCDVPPWQHAVVRAPACAFPWRSGAYRLGERGAAWARLPPSPRRAEAPGMRSEPGTACRPRPFCAGPCCGAEQC